MNMKEFALYSNSHWKPLKGFKQISDSHIFISERSIMATGRAVDGRAAGWPPGGHLGSFGSQQRVTACPEEVTVEMAGGGRMRELSRK